MVHVLHFFNHLSQILFRAVLCTLSSVRWNDRACRSEPPAIYRASSRSIPIELGAFKVCMPHMLTNACVWSTPTTPPPPHSCAGGPKRWAATPSHKGVVQGKDTTSSTLKWVVKWKGFRKTASYGEEHLSLTPPPLFFRPICSYFVFPCGPNSCCDRRSQRRWR